MSPQPRPRGRMFWRVYLFAILLLVAVTLTIMGTGAVVARTPPPIAYAIEDFESLAKRWPKPLENPAALEAELAEDARKLDGEVVIYSLEGKRIAGEASHLPPLTPKQLAEMKDEPLRERGPRFRSIYSAYLPSKFTPDAYARVMVPMLAPIALRLGLFVAMILVAMAIGSFLFAQWLTSPLLRLTTSAQALGAGDLSVRSGLARRDEVGVLSAAFDEMADRMQRLIRGEKELLANVSHELRTPLARIRMALELAAEGDAAKVQRSLIDVQEDLGELEGIVNNILTTARLDLASGKGAPGQLPLRRERVQPAQLIARCAERFRETHPGRTLEVVNDEVLPELDVDGGLVRRAIDNLVDNARKYSDAGSAIRLTAHAQGSGVEIAVHDRGIGIDAADLERLFTPFFRTDRSRARGSGGVGLGLALARRIAEAHGGTLEARSTPGEGTTMSLRLPPAPPA